MTKTYSIVCETNGESNFSAYSLSLTRDDAFLTSNLLSDRIGKTVRLSDQRTITKTSATELSYADPRTPGSGRGAILIAASLRAGLDDIIEQSRFDRDADDD